jgi:hypothetical protein
MRSPRAFLCHSTVDKTAVRAIGHRLQEAGIQVWIDEAEIRVGESIIEKIAQGICECDFVIAILSNHSVHSSWVKKELSLALTDEIKGVRVKVLPVLIEACSPPLSLRDKLYADMRDGPARESEFAKLVKSAWDLLGPPATTQVKQESLIPEGVGSTPTPSGIGPVGTCIERTWREYRAYRAVSSEHATGVVTVMCGVALMTACLVGQGLPARLMFGAVGAASVLMGALFFTASQYTKAALEDDANLLRALEEITGIDYPGSHAYLAKAQAGRHNREYMIGLRLHGWGVVVGCLMLLLALFAVVSFVVTEVGR